MTTRHPSDGLPQNGSRAIREGTLPRAGADTTTLLLDAMPVPVALLDGERRITYANAEMAHLADEREASALKGRRPGDALACVNKLAFPDAACAETPACGFCGIARALRGARETGTGRATCQFMCRRPTGVVPFDFEIRATDTQLETGPATVLVLSNLAESTSRRTLERILFRDVRDSTRELQDLLSLLREARAPDDGDQAGAIGSGLLDLALRKTCGIAEQIEAQSLIQSGKPCGEERSMPHRQVYGLRVLEERILAVHERLAERGVHLRCRGCVPEPVVNSFPHIVGLVVEALLLTACEAAPAGSTIVAACAEEPDGVRFSFRYAPQHPPGESAPSVPDVLPVSSEDAVGVSAWGAALLARVYLGGRVGIAWHGEAHAELWLRVRDDAEGGARSD